MWEREALRGPYRAAVAEGAMDGGRAGWCMVFGNGRQLGIAG